MNYNRHVNDYRRIRIESTRGLAAQAFRDFSRAWWQLALREYFAANTCQGFGAWYRKVNGLTPEPPQWVWDAAYHVPQR